MWFSFYAIIILYKCGTKANSYLQRGEMLYSVNTENTEGAIKNLQSRETDNIGYTRRRQAKQKHNTICAGHQYTQASKHK